MNLEKLQDTPSWEWPDDADKILLGVLSAKGADLSDRLVAAELSGEFSVINEALTQALLNVVGDDSESQELRSKAVAALGPVLEHSDIMGFEDQDDVLISEKVFLECQETLKQLYVKSDLSKDLRRRILETAVHAPRKWHHAAVRDAYAESDPAWRLTAVFCMGFISGFDTQILEALQDPDPLIHYHAVSAAGNWEIEEAWPMIAELVRSDATEKNLRIAAIGAAASIRPEEASMLFDKLMESDDDELVEAVFESLAMAGGLEEIEDFDDENEDEDDDTMA